MCYIAVILACVIGFGGGDRAEDVGGRIPEGPWRAWLDSPGRELPFGLELKAVGGVWKAWVINGSERLDVPKVTVVGSEITLAFPHYGSAIRATLSADGLRLDGEWNKRGRNDRVVKLAFHAAAGAAPRFPPPVDGADACRSGAAVAGRWAMKFEQDNDACVGVFEASDGGITGTVLTPTGDFRFLAGDFCSEKSGTEKRPGRLRLSAFDGSHAFLITASTQDGETLKGDFWSGDTFHDTWTGKRDAGAALPDAFQQAKGVEGVKLESLAFPDLKGVKRPLSDPMFVGKARVLEVFGSWCPNCNDASQYLVELHKKYKDRGLSIVGLAFEYSGDFSRDAEQVRAFADYHKIEYPLLLAGVADREKASAALPLIDALRAFPTLIVLDAAGKVRAVYTGFSGPATGAEYDQFRVKFESLIEELLGSRKSGPG